MSRKAVVIVILLLGFTSCDIVLRAQAKSPTHFWGFVPLLDPGHLPKGIFGEVIICSSRRAGGFGGFPLGMVMSGRFGADCGILGLNISRIGSRGGGGAGRVTSGGSRCGAGSHGGLRGPGDIGDGRCA